MNKAQLEDKMIKKMTSPVTKAFNILWIILLIVYTLSQLAKLAGLYFIRPEFYTIISCSLKVLTLIVAVGFIIKYVTEPRDRTVSIIAVFMIFVFSVSFNVLSVLYGFLNERPYAYFTSPSGKNKLVVLEGGYLDTEYTAYPVKYHIFYQLQDNGYVVRHEYWGSYDVQVEWISENEAKVKVDFGKGPTTEFYGDNNPDDTIVVTFDDKTS